MDRKYKWKLWTVLILSILILIGLGYLHYLRKGTQPVAVVTPTPAETLAPSGCPTCPADIEFTEEPASTSASEATQTPVPATPTPEATEEPTKEPEITVDIDSDDSINRLINISYPVDPGYVPSDLRVVNIPSAEAEYLRAEAANALEQMYKAAVDNQVYLRIVDGYRSYSEQLALYNYYERVHGKAYTEYVDDHPGASEHQLGLAVDLGWYNGNCQLNPCIATYPQYQWLLDNSYKYGWIARYPDKKSDVTHITYSPWHFRYVGSEEAAKIHDSGLTMEEYYNRPVIVD